MKKEMSITGKLAYPIMVGYPAFVLELEGLRRTSPVQKVNYPNRENICFETENTSYSLHTISEAELFRMRQVETI